MTDSGGLKVRGEGDGVKDSKAGTRLPSQQYRHANTALRFPADGFTGMGLLRVCLVLVINSEAQHECLVLVINSEPQHGGTRPVPCVLVQHPKPG